MKRPWTPLAIGLAALAVLLLAPGMPAVAGQQTFSSTSSGTPPAPLPTPTGLTVSGVYFGIYPGYAPYHPYPPCSTGRCRPIKPVHPVRPVHPPVHPTRPVVPPPVPRPVPPRP